MELFGESSVMVIVGFFLSAVAFVLHLIGFATPYWYKEYSTRSLFGFSIVIDRHQGLWQVCTEKTCARITGMNIECRFI